MKTVILILMLAASRPPELDPNECPYPYDPAQCIGQALKWLPAEPNISVISQVLVHNKKGLACSVTIQEIVNGVPQPIDHVIEPNGIEEDTSPSGGFIQEYMWGFTPHKPKLYYLLFTAKTIDKPHWKPDQRTILVYCDLPDIPFLWTDDIPVIMSKHAQRLWQVAKKLGRPLTAPTTVWR